MILRLAVLLALAVPAAALAQTPVTRIAEVSDSHVAMDFSPDGHRLAVASVNSLRVYDATTGAVLLRDDFDFETYLNDVLFAPDGVHLALAMGDKGLALLDTRQPADPVVLRHEGDWQTLAQTRMDDLFISTDGFRGSAQAFDWQGLTPQEIRFTDLLPRPAFFEDRGLYEPFGEPGPVQLPVYGDEIAYQSYPPDPGATLPSFEALSASWTEPLIWYLYGGFDREGKLFAFEGPGISDLGLITLRQTTGGARALFSIKADTGWQVLLYDPARDAVTMRIEAGAQDLAYLNDAVLSADGMRVALHGTDHSVTIFDLGAAPEGTEPTAAIQTEDEAPAPILALNRAHEGRIVQIALAPDGKTFATRGEGDRVFLWDRESRRQLRAIGGGDQVFSFDYAPDSQSILTVGSVNGPRLWRVADGGLEVELPGRNRLYWAGFVTENRILQCDFEGCAIGARDDFLARRAQEVPYPEIIGQGAARDIRIAPDKGAAVLRFKEGQLLRLDLAQMQFHDAGQVPDAVSLALGADGLALIGTEAGKLQLRNLKATEPIWEADLGAAPRVSALAGTRFLVDLKGSLPFDESLPGTPPERRVFDAATRSFESALPVPPDYFRTSAPGPAAYDPVTETLFAVLQSDVPDPDVRIDIVDMAQASWAGSIRSLATEPARMTFAQGGRMLVIDGARTAVHWDLETGKLVDRRPSSILARSGAAGDAVAYLETAPERWGELRIRGAALGDRAVDWARPEGSENSFGPEFEQLVSNGSELLAVGACRFGTEGDCTVTAALFDLDRIGRGEAGAAHVVDFAEVSGGASFLLSPDGTVALAAGFDMLTAYDTTTGATLWRSEFDPNFVSPGAVFAPDGATVLLERRSNQLFEIRDTVTGALRGQIENDDYLVQITLAAAETGTGQLLRFDEARVSLLDPTGEIGASIALQGGLYGTTRWDPQSGAIFIDDGAGRNLLWHPGTGNVSTIEAHVATGKAPAFSPDGDLLALIETSGLVSLWRVETGARVARLAGLRDGNWAVIGNDGRYDASDPGDFPALGWVLPEAPTRVLPLELFYREFFEPALLPRLIRGEAFAPLPDLRGINRLQPTLRFERIEADPDHPGSTRVVIEISETEADGARSGIGPIKLFRDGQMVGLHEFDTGTQGPQSVVFDDILMPEADRPSVFTAYGFNADGIKSETIRERFTPTAPPSTPRKPRAYVISVGVDSYANPAWDLNYAGADAELSASEIAPRLRAGGAFDRVVELPMISRVGTPPQAERAQIEAVLRRLAGETVDESLLAGLPGAAAFDRARPEDFVYFFFAGHGLAGRDGRFHLFPADFGKGASGRKIGPDELAQTLPSDVLSNLLLRIQAGRMVMVIDACNSAASVEGGGFKPGPMGSRGLGQLAYDKGMRVLTASQAEGVALESDQLRHGMLSYAMFEEGLEDQRADRAPVDQRVSFAELLDFATTRVPDLYLEIANDQFQPVQRGTMDLSFVVDGTAPTEPEGGRFLQRPALFDFSDRASNDAVYLGLGG